jgi:hypothetical protein
MVSLEAVEYTTKAKACGAWQANEGTIYEVLTLSLTNGEDSILESNDFYFLGETSHGEAVRSCADTLVDVSRFGTQEVDVTFKLRDFGDGTGSLVAFVSLYHFDGPDDQLVVRQQIRYKQPEPPAPPPVDAPDIVFDQAIDDSGTTVQFTVLDHESGNWRNFMWIFEEPSHSSCYVRDPSGRENNQLGGGNGDDQVIRNGDAATVTGYGEVTCYLTLSYWDPETHETADVEKWALNFWGDLPDVQFEVDQANRVIEVASAATLDFEDLEFQFMPDSMSQAHQWNVTLPSGAVVTGSGERQSLGTGPVVVGADIHVDPNEYTSYCNFRLWHKPSGLALGEWQFSGTSYGT